MFLLLILRGAVDHFVHRLADDNPVSGSQREEGVGATFHIPDQFGIKHKRLAVESCQFDHVQLPVCFSRDVQASRAEKCAHENRH